MQVAAPPKGSISVGWLCVSFLNMSSHGSLRPATSTSILMEQALISSLSSRLLSFPCALRAFAPMVATSMRFMGLGPPSRPAYTVCRSDR